MALGTVEEGATVRVVVGFALGVVEEDGFNVGALVDGNAEGVDENGTPVGTI